MLIPSDLSFLVKGVNYETLLETYLQRKILQNIMDDSFNYPFTLYSRKNFCFCTKINLFNLNLDNIYSSTNLHL